MSREGATSAKFVNYYEVLRVRPFHTSEFIQNRFLEEIKKWHPDKHTKSTSDDKQIALYRTKLLLEARTVLTDSLKKAAYDAQFESLYPRRFQKLSTPIDLNGKKKTSTQNQLNESISPTPGTKKAYWYDFASKVNRKTKQVTYNLQRFLDFNPNHEARMRFNINSEWTEFSRKAIYKVNYNNLNVALVEMQIRYKGSNGKYHYAKPIMKVIILSQDPFDAMRDKYLIYRNLEKQRKRMAFKVVYVLVSSGILALQAYSPIYWV